ALQELESQRDQAKRLTKVVQAQTELAARAAKELAESRDLYAKAQQETRKRVEELRKREVELRNLQVTHQVLLKRSIQLQDRIRELEAIAEKVRIPALEVTVTSVRLEGGPRGAADVGGVVKR